MKQVKWKFPLRSFAVAGSLLLSAVAFAQSGGLKGQVKDATGEPIIGATIMANGKAVGVTDFDGNYVINVPKGTELTITYVGMSPKKVIAADNLSTTLQDDNKTLNEVVVIGYGAVKKSDLTGSVAQLQPDGKNRGLVVNAQDLMQGKMAGVSITTGGGTPGSGASIRIRGGSSLNASNDPLIVIDGVPMDNNGVPNGDKGIQGMANPLSMVNPQDIESFNVLKDASATAIYGSRGSNGVIIITTKRGHANQPVRVSYAGNMTLSTRRKSLDVLNADEYRDLVKRIYAGNQREAVALKALGTANTDWQKEIYRTALSHDQNITVSGSQALGAAKGYLPWRMSMGYTNQQGIVKTSSFERYTAAFNLNPHLLNDHLSFNFNAKGMFAKNRFADKDAMNAAVRMDPTQPVYDTTSPYAANFGGYFAWTKDGSSLNDPTYSKTKNALAPNNPVADLMLKNDHYTGRDFIGNADVDYKVHGFEDLRFHATAGADVSSGEQDTDVAPTSPLNFYFGSTGFKRLLKRNLLFNAYTQYYHDFKDKLQNHVDIMAGYEWQHFWRKETSRYFSYYPSTNTVHPGAINSDSGQDYDGDGVKEPHRYLTENYLVSFFGRANWNLLQRYYLTATVRADGASRFRKHWATFPSFAFAWRVKDEAAFKNMAWLSDLKLRLGWGMTGQQEGIGDYTYFDTYQVNTGANGFYPIFGNGTMVRPDAVNKNLKWETTTTYNAGIDWGVLNNRLTGSFDWYYRKTTDLLNTVYVPAGSNFRNQVISNIGDLSNTGVEATVSYTILNEQNTKDWFWKVDYNFTYNRNKITNLTGGDANYYVTPGSMAISTGTGLNVGAHKVGHPANSFLVYQQMYDANGKPIEGAVVDRNHDGQITDADRYIYKQAAPPVTMGFSSRIEYKTWDLGFTLRANIGNYLYNDTYASRANMSAAELYSTNEYFSNLPRAVIKDNWQTFDERALLSDRWVQNASFLKLDNISLGYSFSNLLKCNHYKGINGRIYASASNVFTITKYDGIDPEVFNGVDRDIYPRPFSLIVGVNLNF